MVRHSIEQSDLDAVAKTFRSVADCEAFDQMLEAWARRLAAGRVPDDSPLNQYAAEAVELLAAPDLMPTLDPLEHAVTAVDAPAIVLSPDLRVVVSNAKGEVRFQAKQGQLLHTEGMMQDGLSSIRELQSSARGRGNRTHSILRLQNKEGGVSLCEAYVLEADSLERRFIVLRSLEHTWVPSVGERLREAFGMTKAEVEVSRLLAIGLTAEDVAAHRNKSLHTVRTQIKTILGKTEARSQVDLIRLLGLICARASNERRETTTTWSDPWGNLDFVMRPDGFRTAYSWTGDPDGKPVLLMHGLSLGFMLGDQIEKELARAGLKLIAPCVPGAGGSEMNPALSASENDIAAYTHLADTLGLSRCHSVGFATGGVSLLRLERARPGTLNSILCFSDCLPLTKKRLAKAPPTFRTMLRLPVNMPTLLQLVADTGFRNIRRKGIDWYVERRYHQSPVDRASCADPELLPLMRNWCELTFSMGPENFCLRSMQRWEFSPTEMDDLPVPLHVVMGAEEPMLDERDLSGYRNRDARFSYEIVDRAGELLLHQEPALVMDRIIKKFS